MTDLTTLLAEIEAAPEGNRDLDVWVHFTVFPEVAQRSELPVHDDVESGCYWERIGVGHSLRTTPCYTTSLDAKLPGENIVEVKRIGLKWMAIHEGLESGDWFRVEAHTMCLAMRAAAIRGMMEKADE